MFFNFTRKLRDRAFTMEPWHRTLAIMFLAQMCTAVGFSIIFPFLPLYVEDLGTNTSLSIEFWAGMVFSAQAITMMFASPLWGALADRYGRKLMVERAMFGGTIIIFLMAFARSAEELVLLRAIQGLITGTVSAANALVAASAPRNRTGFAMATIQVGLWSGVALGPLIGGALADAYGFRMPFFITAAMLLISGVLVHMLIHEEFAPETKPADQQRSFWGKWRHILSMPGVGQTYIVRFLTGLTRSMVIPIMPLFVAALLAQSAAGIDLPGRYADVAFAVGLVGTTTGLVIGISSATSTASAIYLGRLGDRIGHRSVLIGSAFVAMLLYIPQIFVTEAWQLIFLQGLTGLAYGGIVAAPSALLAQFTEPGEEGAVYGLDNSVVAGARALAPLLGAGIAYGFGLRATFVGLCIVFLAVMVISMALLPRHTPVMQPESTPEPDVSPINGELQPTGAD